MIWLCSFTPTFTTVALVPSWSHHLSPGPCFVHFLGIRTLLHWHSLLKDCVRVYVLEVLLTGITWDQISFLTLLIASHVILKLFDDISSLNSQLLLYLQCLVQYLEHSRSSRNLCWTEMIIFTFPLNQYSLHWSLDLLYSLPWQWCRLPFGDAALRVLVNEHFNPDS